MRYPACIRANGTEAAGAGKGPASRAAIAEGLQKGKRGENFRCDRGAEIAIRGSERV